MNPHLLVIGYGNELRRDDGVGPQVARAVMEWARPDVRAVAVHQLTPELVEVIAEAERVVFVDAGAVGQRNLEYSPCLPVSLSPSATVASCLGHFSDPRELLDLTQVLYGRHPAAWLIAVPAPDLEFGTGLSATAERSREDALHQIHILAGHS